MLSSMLAHKSKPTHLHLIENALSLNKLVHMIICKEAFFLVKTCNLYAKDHVLDIFLCFGMIQYYISHYKTKEKLKKN